MNQQDEVFQTLQRFTSVVKDSPLVKLLSDLVEIQFAVVGGAVRDSVLGKPIKDIDISVRFNFYHNLKINYSSSNCSDDEWKHSDDESAIKEADALKGRNCQIQTVMERDEFSAIRKNPRYPLKFNASAALVCLTEYLVQQHPDYAFGERLGKNKSIIPGNELEINKVAYRFVGLNAVIGIVDKKSQYPVEVLFIQDRIDTFVDQFDFNLCKIKMLDNRGMLEIVPSLLFIKDKESMTMTYQPIFGVTPEQMNKSLLVRYERLQKKFSEYELTSDVNHLNKNMKETVEQAVKTVSLYHKIKKLPDKANIARANKI